jgi:hypothetical protein
MSTRQESSEPGLTLALGSPEQEGVDMSEDVALIHSRQQIAQERVTPRNADPVLDRQMLRSCLAWQFR